MTQIGIIGSAGYTGGELIRLLQHHPKVKIRSIVSQSQAGLPIQSVHRDLLGELNMTFDTALAEDVDVVFLCMGHGKSRDYIESNTDLLNKKIIDLSTDYRPRNNPFHFIYGLPEINRESIKSASRVANPGCFATAIQLAFLPLAKAQRLSDTLHITGITGSTGAGQKNVPTTHFSWRTNNVSIYKLFDHQHLSEVKESIVQLQSSFTQDALFVPIRGNFTRGILISAYTNCSLAQEAAISLYKEYYRDAAFTHVADSEVSLKEVINTNKCHIHITVSHGHIHITSVIDNLLKGASGQAVQNMNLMMGWPEYLGLKLKSVVF